MATKNFAQTHLSHELVSNLSIMTDPDYQDTILQLYKSMDTGVLDLIYNQIPNMREAKNDLTTWAEVGSDFEESFVISARSVAGSLITLTYSTTDMKTIGGVTKSPFVEGDDVIVYDPTTGFEAMGKIRTKTEGIPLHTVVVEPMNGTENFIAAAVVGATVLAGGHSVSEASIAGKGVVRDIRTYSNTIGFTRADFTITDKAKFDPSWFNFEGKDGQVTRYYADGMERLNAVRFLKNLGLQMMIGRESNLDMVGADGVVYKNEGTKGYITQIRETGNILPYSPTPTLDDLYAIADIGRDSGVDNMYKAKCGSDYMNYIEQSILRQFPNGAIEYMKDNSKALDLRVGKFFLGAWEFEFMNYDMFNHKELLGNRSLNYRGLALFCPTGERVDALTGESMPAMMMSYKTPVGSKNGRIAGVGKPFFKMWETGGAANSNQDGDHVKRTHYIGHIRPEVRGTQQFILHQKAL